MFCYPDRYLLSREEENIFPYNVAVPLCLPGEICIAVKLWKIYNERKKDEDYE